MAKGDQEFAHNFDKSLVGASNVAADDGEDITAMDLDDPNHEPEASRKDGIRLYESTGGEDDDIDVAFADEDDDDDGEEQEQEPEPEPEPEGDGEETAQSEVALLRARIDSMQQQADDNRRQQQEQEARAVAEAASKEKRDELEGGIAALREQLKEAIEEGDTDAQLELTEKLVDARADLKRVQEPVVAAVKQPTEPAQMQVPPAMDEWLRGNEWFVDPEKKAEQAYAFQLDAVITEDGYTPGSKAYFREITSRMKAKFPELYAKGKAETPEQTKERQQRARSIGPAPARAAQETKQTRNRVVLTRADRKAMETFRLDPSNPEHLKAYARGKRGEF